YWTNFAKNGNPNGPGLPEWPGYNNTDGYKLMHLHAGTITGAQPSRVPHLMPYAAPDALRSRYELLDRIANEGIQQQSSNALKRRASTSIKRIWLYWFIT